MTIAEFLPDEIVTIRDLLRYTVTTYNEAGLYFGHGFPNAHEEASYLILSTLHLPFDQKDLWLDASLTEQEKDKLFTLIKRRVTEKVPVAYLTHEAWLGDYRFYVDERTIVPRSFIADALFNDFDNWFDEPESVKHVADLCTGGGSLAILLALLFPQATVDAVDISNDALDVAKINVAQYRLEKQVHLHLGNLFEGLPKNRHYSLIISNPPYVDAHAMSSLPAEYQAEPNLALASGEDGLDHVRRLLKEAPQYLTKNGLLVVEIGHNRSALENAFPHLPFLFLSLPGGDDYVFVLRREDLV
ncbi:50S ribosomal protein L3 N(5)-glutamine methyltransferase [Ferrovum sp. PN-J185]|uniref:50S ribosomal protein L3 N(5)-glutamine methyltransferase n=1 Tax=Ferrovum sp. PN-J185 TaxID=1356306 RepID=UPI000799D2B3|nr:50S ribosomal protein L3 N(5)-glutamine methyltransferase [Ferrovum sp. PN-J185]KXW56289.1 50S ribosomal protein L3 glutamine methyltransferase [Ferrovum sp. PN-J185]MCC6069013.1 50S ribosomal protein L3 N(5)-glutamine methyltransferase [Ferrovum sp. PN-J185]MDE1891007.1 50S ribosomal protein L3 N(5)-glutamine methyltransferase [Betaproteobacteria bacterium]MDE2055681.1 50S ribosomal protein L3 N(5)-glutamine methyltransferase [Betaproteobacteria bacterium]